MNNVVPPVHLARSGPSSVADVHTKSSSSSLLCGQISTVDTRYRDHSRCRLNRALREELRVVDITFSPR